MKIRDDTALRKLAATLDGVFYVGGLPWRNAGGILKPLAAPHVVRDVDRKEVRARLSESGALLARWTDCWNSEESKWWWTCCDDKEYELAGIRSSRARRGIRKGLRNCEVRKIGAGEFANDSFPIHSAALRSYGLGESRVPSRDQYAESVARRAQFEGAEYWGAYHQDEMIAFASCLVIDDAMIFGSTKSDPSRHSLCPNNALFYEITRHYLVDRGLRYVTNGSRTLAHPTAINDFLIRMGYRKIFCRLNVELSMRAGWIQSSGIIPLLGKTGLSRLLGRRWASLEAFSRLNRIARTFSS